jgi:hypothetical protein
MVITSLLLSGLIQPAAGLLFAEQECHRLIFDFAHRL